MDALKKFTEHFGDSGKEVMKLGNLGNRVCTYIFAGFVELCMLCPINRIISESDAYIYFVIVAAWAALAANFHINHYVVQSEEGKRVTIYQKLTYIPVARKTIQEALLKRLLRYIGITTIIAVVLQVGMTLLVSPQYVWQNLLYAVCVMGVMPFVVGLLLIYTRR